MAVRYAWMNNMVRYRVYAIIPHPNEEDQRWYIGCTHTLRVRLAKHLSSGQWTHVFDYVVLDRSESSEWGFDRAAMEREWIRRFDPTMLRNKVGKL